MNSVDSSSRIGPVGKWGVEHHDDSPATEAVQEEIVWTHAVTGLQVRLRVLRTVCSLRVRAGGVDTTLSLGFPLDRRAALQQARQWMAGHPRGDPPALVGEEVGA